MNIGLAGTGRMGTAIVERLIKQGHDLIVWNRTADKTKAALEAGARGAGTPRELAQGAEIVITILTDADAIDRIYRGRDGLLAAAGPGKLFIDMSTVRPETERRLAKDVAATGAQFVECPVGGSTGPAREGRLFGFAGADAEAFGRAKPVLEQICRRIEHVGPPGAGASMKLAINLPLMVWWQAIGEAMSLVQELGLDPARLIDIFSDTSGGPNVLKSRGPMIVAALSGRSTGPTTFSIDSARKDLRTMLDEAHALGRTLPVAGRTLEVIEALAREARGVMDGVNIPAFWLGDRLKLADGPSAARGSGAKKTVPMKKAIKKKTAAKKSTAKSARKGTAKGKPARRGAGARAARR